MYYEKTFDTIDHCAMFRALVDCINDYRYTGVIKRVYTNAAVHIMSHEDTPTIRIRRGERQGMLFLPMLFTTFLKYMYKSANNENIEINMNRKT